MTRCRTNQKGPIAPSRSGRGKTFPVKTANTRNLRWKYSRRLWTALPRWTPTATRPLQQQRASPSRSVRCQLPVPSHAGSMNCAGEGFFRAYVNTAVRLGVATNAYNSPCLLQGLASQSASTLQLAELTRVREVVAALLTQGHVGLEPLARALSRLGLTCTLRSGRSTGPNSQYLSVLCHQFLICQVTSRGASVTQDTYTGYRTPFGPSLRTDRLQRCKVLLRNH